MTKLSKFTSCLDTQEDFSQEQWNELLNQKKSEQGDDSIDENDISYLVIKCIDLGKFIPFQRLIENFELDILKKINFTKSMDISIFQYAFMDMASKYNIDFKFVEFLIQRNPKVLKEFYNIGTTSAEYTPAGIAITLSIHDRKKLATLCNLLKKYNIDFKEPIAIVQGNIYITALDYAILSNAKPEVIEELINLIGFSPLRYNKQCYIDFLISIYQTKPHISDYIRIFMREKIKLLLNISDKSYNNNIDKMLVSLYKGDIKQNIGKSTKILEYFSALANEVNKLPAASNIEEFAKSKDNIKSAICKLKSFGCKFNEVEKKLEMLDYQDKSKRNKITKFILASCFIIHISVNALLICMKTNKLNTPDIFKNIIDVMFKNSENSKLFGLMSSVIAISLFATAYNIDTKKPILPKEFKQKGLMVSL